MVKQISLTELNERIADALQDRNLLIERTAGYSEWHDVSLEKFDEFAGALEKIIRGLRIESGN